MKNKPIISKSEMIAVHNAVTGEMESAKVSVYVERVRPKYTKEPFTILFQGISLAISRKIAPVTAKVLLYLMSCAQYENVIIQNINEIAKELGYEKTAIWRALKELEEMNVLLRGIDSADKRRNIYQLHPAQSWKGKPEERYKAIERTRNNNQLLLFEEKKALPQGMKPLPK